MHIHIGSHKSFYQPKYFISKSLRSINVYQLQTVDFTLLNNPDIKNRLKGTVTPSMLLLLCTVTSPAAVHWLLLTVEKVAGVIPSPSCVCSPSLTQVEVLHSQVIGNSTSAVGASVNACLLWKLTFDVASWSEMANMKKKKRKKSRSYWVLLSHGVLVPTSSWVSNLLVCQDGWASATNAFALQAVHGTDTTDICVFFSSGSQVFTIKI